MGKSQRAGRIPLRHLSVRVPWHDADWDGTVCKFPRENASCLALNRIGATKDDALDLDKLYAVARRYGIEKRYDHLNAVQVRMNIGGHLALQGSVQRI